MAIYENGRVFTHAIDLISVNNSLLLKTLLDFIENFFTNLSEGAVRER